MLEMLRPVVLTAGQVLLVRRAAVGRVTNRRLRTEELASSTVVLQQDTQRVRGAFKARER